MESYRTNLRHIARPDNPSERDSADKVMLSDFEAVFVQRALEEYIGYGDVTEGERSVARGYAEYINQCVREEQRRQITLFAHTTVAKRVLRNAVREKSTTYKQAQAMLVDVLEDL